MTKLSVMWVGMLVIGGAAWADPGTNVLPQAESFEAYPDGYAINQASGWSILPNSRPGAGTVTTNPEALTALAAYTNGGGTLPLATTHDKILELGDSVAQQVAAPEGRLVRTDFLLLPSFSEDLPPADPLLQVSLVFNTNGQPVILQRDPLTGTNAWLTLAQATPVASQSWVRLTFLQDYSNHLFQVRLNEAVPIEDVQGWSGPPPEGTNGGAWFHMPATNGTMHRLAFAGDAQAFLDDVEIVSELPTIATLPPSNVTAVTADLVGYLSFTGLAQTAVAVYWGTTDGGTNAVDWANTNVWDAPQTPGSFTTNVTVTTDTVVFYRFAATNAYGPVWSDHSELLMVGAVSLDPDSDNGAKERPVETGLFTILRPEFATNVALTVQYAMSGSAANGVDYVFLPGTAVIPLGATRVDILLTPIPDGIQESNETARLTLLPGNYLIGSPNTKQVTIENAQPLTLTWSNESGDRQWNSSSSNWFGGGLFSPLDSVVFGDTALATGRVTVTMANVIPGQMKVTGGLYEFDGGAILGGPVLIQGGRVIDRVLTRSLFGSGAIALSGGGEFWRQATNDTIPALQVLSNAFSVAGTGGTLQGGRGTNEWRGSVELKARLYLGLTNAVVGHINRFSGALVVNQDASSTAARVLSLRAGGGAAYLDGPIVDDPETNHTGAFPLWLETAAGADGLTLGGANLYACGTVVTNAGSTNGVVVEVGSSLGGGPVTVVGTGARLRVQGAGAIAAPLLIGSNATVTLAADGAVMGAGSTVTVGNGGLLVLERDNCLPDDSALNLGLSGRVQIGSNLVESVRDLYIDGQLQPGGLYTSNRCDCILGDGAIRVRGARPEGVMILVR